jgi:monovalent cation:H+ antiporter-2, CPA2 family
VRRARLLIVATPDSFLTRRVVEVARAANPSIEIVVRTHSHAEFERLRREHRGTIVMGEHELARAMLLHALRHFGVPRERALLLVQDEPGAQVEVDADRR